MNTTQALSILSEQFNATYTGSKTVREMCSNLLDAMYWDKEDPNTVYHQFKTQDGMPNRIVKDDQIISLALSYSN